MAGEDLKLETMSITSPNHGAAPSRRWRFGFVHRFLCFMRFVSAAGSSQRRHLCSSNRRAS
jgi:hypothetical protein